MRSMSWSRRKSSPSPTASAHDGEDALTIERRFPEAVREELARRGHPVKTVGDLDGPCSVEIIRRDGATEMLLAGSDPRRDGWALAW
jgi:gamma-glutamyltranspeptidase